MKSKITKLILGLLLYFSASSKHRVFTSYTVSDGLTNNAIRKVYQDPKGYLWICTWEGLNKYDGHQFTGYTIRNGLPHSMVNDVIGFGKDKLLVAMNDGSIQGSGNNCPLTLQAHPGGQVTYQWYRNNILLVGATQRNYSATTSGSYSVTVTRDGCTGIAPPVTITTCPPIVTREYTRNTSEPLPVLDKIRIHPNPASEYFITELDLGEVINEEATIELLTLTETIVTTQKTRIIHGRIQYRMRLDGYWTENVYLVRITTTKRVFTAKLLIIRS